MKDFVQKNQIQKKLDKLAKKYKNKKVVFYGASGFLAEIINACDISKLNIIGIADKKFEDGESFMGFPAFSAEKFLEQKPDIVLISILTPNIAEDFFKKNLIPVFGNFKYERIYQKNFAEKFKAGIFSCEKIPAPIDFCSDFFIKKLLIENKKEAQFFAKKIFAKTLLSYANFLYKTGENFDEIKKLYFLSIDFNKEFSLEAYKNYVEFLRKTDDKSEELLNIFSELELHPQAWEKSNSDLWLHYVCELMKAEKLDIAKELLQKFYEKFGFSNINEFLPAAFLANSIGISDEKIKKSAYVFEKLEENRKNNVFENYLKGKTPAVVGNSPCEKNFGKGQEIDGHDVVIRFNNYTIQGFEKDYGAKTNVWARVYFLNESIDRQDIDEYDFVLLNFNLWQEKIPTEFLKILYRDINKKPHFYLYCRQKCVQETGILKPTLGFITLWYLSKILPPANFSRKNIYGFSFLNNTIEETNSHYFADRTLKEGKARSYFHNMDKESQILNKIF